MFEKEVEKELEKGKLLSVVCRRSSDASESQDESTVWNTSTNGSQNCTCGRGLQQFGRAGACRLEVLVHQINKHGRDIGATALVPVTVDGQPVPKILSLLACIAMD